MTSTKCNKLTVWPFAAAFVILAVAILATSAMTAPAEAQDPAGSINNLLVSSPNPNQLLITWESPADTPKDYRVRWTPSDQDYLSRSAQNTDERGSAYPTTLTHTVDGLTAGTEYKVQVRARYLGNSGPWTDEVTTTVSSMVVEEDDPPPPPVVDDPPASDEATNLALSSDVAGQLVITWDAPTDALKDFRLVWAPVGQSYPGGMLRAHQTKVMPTQQEQRTPSPT